jgi:hypothetical protein
MAIGGDTASPRGGQPLTPPQPTKFSADDAFEQLIQDTRWLVDVDVAILFLFDRRQDKLYMRREPLRH